MMLLFKTLFRTFLKSSHYNIQLMIWDWWLKLWRMILLRFHTHLDSIFFSYFEFVLLKNRVTLFIKNPVSLVDYHCLCFYYGWYFVFYKENLQCFKYYKADKVSQHSRGVVPGGKERCSVLIAAASWLHHLRRLWWINDCECIGLWWINDCERIILPVVYMLEFEEELGYNISMYFKKNNNVFYNLKRWFVSPWIAEIPQFGTAPLLIWAVPE